MYNVKEIEKKWQNYWYTNDSFKAVFDNSKEKYYSLVEFPYPSGSGMHVGHIKAYMGLEVLSRMKRCQGYNVLFPIGFDAFGLPTENYAIKTKKHPREITDINIKTFISQLKEVGFSFDFDRVIDTTDPKYYKWTQFIFLKLFENNLAYRDKTYVNYCPSCKVILSNEDSQGGKCDRCSSDVIQKEKDVWFLRITEYADKLLEGLDFVKYNERVKTGQRNWIGKSTGAFVSFDVKDTDIKLKVYTTRCDTLFGATFMVIAPEHSLIDEYKSRINNFNEILDYRLKAKKKSEFERTQLVKDKTGVKLDGLVAINPVNGKEIPIFISDYVMVNYGSGAIMAVPAHDSRDYEFAKKFNLDIIPVIENSNIEKEAYTDISNGKLINSEFLNGLSVSDAKSKMLSFLKEKEIGSKAVQYKMQDWAFNRQRYWGEPIPIVHCKKCGMVPVPYDELPLKLPDINDFVPNSNGESPLALIPSFVNCKCPKCGDDALRETDTMPQWAGSSWYYLRYMDPFNDKEIASKEKMEYWNMVDWYNGGMEHVTRHMIYSRFWHRFLYDIGVVPFKEPYMKRTTQGLVLGPDHEKMSKSKGNVINPSDIVLEYGADTLRVYVMFLGEYDKEGIWNVNGVKGIKRFLDRVYNLYENVDKNNNSISKDMEVIINKTIMEVTNDIEKMKYNTAISKMMILLNEFYKKDSISKFDYEVLIRLLYPFAPHLSEEVWSMLNNSNSLVKNSWPSYDLDKTKDEKVTIVVQVNSKMKGKFLIDFDSSKEVVEKKAFEIENVKNSIENKEVIKVIVVPNKIVNIVIK